jgi:hypothetical protein
MFGASTTTAFCCTWRTAAAWWSSRTFAAGGMQAKFSFGSDCTCCAAARSFGRASMNASHWASLATFEVWRGSTWWTSRRTFSQSKLRFGGTTDIRPEGVDSRMRAGCHLGDVGQHMGATGQFGACLTFGAQGRARYARVLHDESVRDERLARRWALLGWQVLGVERDVGEIGRLVLLEGRAVAQARIELQPVVPIGQLRVPARRAVRQNERHTAIVATHPKPERPLSMCGE